MQINEPTKKYICSFNCRIAGYAVGDEFRNTLDFSGDDPLALAQTAAETHGRYYSNEYTFIPVYFIPKIYAFVKDEKEAIVAIVTTTKEFLNGR
jgi:hypothetical protein